MSLTAKTIAELRDGFRDGLGAPSPKEPVSA